MRLVWLSTTVGVLEHHPRRHDHRRKNSGTMTNSSGDFLRNGTLIEITRRPHRDGSI